MENDDRSCAVCKQRCKISCIFAGVLTGERSWKYNLLKAILKIKN